MDESRAVKAQEGAGSRSLLASEGDEAAPHQTPAKYQPRLPALNAPACLQTRYLTGEEVGTHSLSGVVVTLVAQLCPALSQPHGL